MTQLLHMQKNIFLNFHLLKNVDEILIKTQFSKVTRDLHKLLFSLQVYPLASYQWRAAPVWRHQGYKVKDFFSLLIGI